MRKEIAIADAPAHAKRSPSSSHRWLECPGSINLCGDLPDIPNEYSAEGTMLHHFTYLRIKAWWLSRGVVLPIVGSVHEFDGFTFTVTDEHIESIEWW